jgi:hypothetical protein
MTDASETETAFDEERRTLKDACESGRGSTIAGEPRYAEEIDKDGTVVQKWMDMESVGPGGVYTITRHPDGGITQRTSFPVGTRRVYNGVGSDGRPSIITRVSDPPDSSDTSGPDFLPDSQGPTLGPQMVQQSSEPSASVTRGAAPGGE